MEECKYCKPKNPKTLIGGKGDYISAWVKIYVNENDVRIGLNVRGETDLSTSIPINYCPMCGKKFNIEERKKE